MFIIFHSNKVKSSHLLSNNNNNNHNHNQSNIMAFRLTERRPRNNNNNDGQQTHQQKIYAGYEFIIPTINAMDTIGIGFDLGYATDEVKKLAKKIADVENCEGLDAERAYIAEFAGPICLGFLHHNSGISSILNGFEYIARQYALPTATVAGKTALQEYSTLLSGLLLQLFRFTKELPLKIMQTIQQDDPFGTILPGCECMGPLVAALLSFSFTHDDPDHRFHPASDQEETAFIRGNHETYRVGELCRVSFEQIRTLLGKFTLESRLWILIDDPKDPEDDRDKRGNAGRYLHGKLMNYIGQSEWNTSLPPIGVHADPNAALMRSRYQEAARLVMSVQTALIAP